METIGIIALAVILGMILALVFGGITGLFVTFAMFAGAIILYFLPTICAIYRKHPSTLWIFLLNIFFGWSILGWVIAIFWAFGADKTIEEFIEFKKQKAAKEKDEEIIEACPIDGNKD